MKVRYYFMQCTCLQAQRRDIKLKNTITTAS